MLRYAFPIIGLLAWLYSRANTSDASRNRVSGDIRHGRKSVRCSVIAATDGLSQRCVQKGARRPSPEVGNARAYRYFDEPVYVGDVLADDPRLMCESAFSTRKAAPRTYGLVADAPNGCAPYAGDASFMGEGRSPAAYATIRRSLNTRTMRLSLTWKGS